MIATSGQALPTAPADEDDISTPQAEELLVGIYRLYGRLVYPAVEHKPVDNLPLDQLVHGRTLDLYEEVQSRDYLTVHTSGGKLILQAGGCVGLLPLNDRVALDVAPRVPIGNLMRLLELSGLAPAVPATYLLGRYRIHGQGYPSLLNVLALALLDAVDAVAVQGLHRAYQREVADTSFPRGRILLGETMRRHHARGATHRVTASWFTPSIDTAPNRCLKYTIWRLAQIYRQGKPPKKASSREREAYRQIIARLNQAYSYFGSVLLDPKARFLSDPLVSDPSTLPAIRAYYAQALQLSLILIRNQGLTFGENATVEAPTFLIKVADVFESYIRKTLARTLPTHMPDIVVLDGNPGQPGNRPLFLPGSDARLMRAQESTASPDIVLQRAGAAATKPSYPVILDTKYKDRPPDRNDVNQAIVYGLVYEAPSVVLLYPYDPERHATQPRLQPIGQVSGIELYRYFFDLSGSILENEEEDLAETIAQLISR